MVFTTLRQFPRPIRKSANTELLVNGPAMLRLLGLKQSNGYFQTREIRKILATSFQEIDEVVSVCAQISADESVVWSLLESYDRDVQTRVYEKELEICERLRMYDFDFRVTSIDLVSPAELMAGGFQEIFKR